MSARRPWSEEERALVRAQYKRKGPEWIGRRINRSAGSVCSVALRMGLCRRAWTAEEDAVVVREWGEVCPRVLRSKLPGRTWIAIRRHAVTALGLETGVPQGFVSLEEAARRLGYESGTFVLRLAERTGLTIRKHPRPRDAGPRVSGRRIVEWDAVRDAFTREQRETESVAGAARSRGMCNIQLWRWLCKAGALPEMQPGQRKRGMMHIPSETIDRVVAERRPVDIGPRELVSVAADRLSVGRTALARWLAREGFRLGKGNRAGAPVALIEQVVAERRAARAA